MKKKGDKYDKYKKKNQNLNSLIFMVIIKRCLLGLCLCVNLTILAFKKKKKI